MANPSLPPEVETLIDDLVAHYVTHLGQYRRFLKALHQQISDAVDSENGHPLSKLVHSVKFRLKDQKGFKRKLIRKWEKFQKKGESFPYTKEYPPENWGPSWLSHSPPTHTSIRGNKLAPRAPS